jgi:hypothetical protein
MCVGRTGCWILVDGVVLSSAFGPPLPLPPAVSLSLLFLMPFACAVSRTSDGASRRVVSGLGRERERGGGKSGVAVLHANHVSLLFFTLLCVCFPFSFSLRVLINKKKCWRGAGPWSLWLICAAAAVVRVW